MNFKIKDINIHISFYFLVIISLTVAIDKTIISLYFLISILIHELGHLITIWLFQIKIDIILFKMYGIHIQIKQNTHISYFKEICVLLAGPLFNLIICLISYIFNKEIACFCFLNFFLGLFNLLPIESLDGGKITNLLFSCFLPTKTSYNISFHISMLFTCIFCIIDFFFIIHGKFNITLTILCITLILKIINN